MEHFLPIVPSRAYISHSSAADERNNFVRAETNAYASAIQTQIAAEPYLERKTRNLLTKLSFRGRRESGL